MNGKIRAVIFDFGNVLVRWDPLAVFDRYFPSRQKAEAFMHEVSFMEWNAHQDAGRSFKEGVTELAGQFPHHREAIEAYQLHWEDSITVVLEETVDIVRALKAMGIPLYILSNFSLETFPIMRERYQFLSLFDEIYLSAQFRIVKPDPRIFEAALEKIQLPASDCIFIDDSHANIDTARRLGFKSIHFRSPTLLGEELKLIFDLQNKQNKWS